VLYGTKYKSFYVVVGEAVLYFTDKKRKITNIYNNLHQIVLHRTSSKLLWAYIKGIPRDQQRFIQEEER
jgi:hypothetical protein